MKKLFLIFSMLIMTAPAFAQHVNCQVVMVDRFNRVIHRYFGQRDWRTGMCRNALRQCNLDIRRRNIFGARCAQLRGNGW